MIEYACDGRVDRAAKATPLGRNIDKGKRLEEILACCVMTWFDTEKARRAGISEVGDKGSAQPAMSPR